jgi:hypothetical protein
MATTVRIEEAANQNAADTRAQILSGLGFTTAVVSGPITLIRARISADGNTATNTSIQQIAANFLVIGTLSDTP